MRVEISYMRTFLSFTYAKSTTPAVFFYLGRAFLRSTGGAGLNMYFGFSTSSTVVRRSFVPVGQVKLVRDSENRRAQTRTTD